MTQSDFAKLMGVHGGMVTQEVERWLKVLR